MSVVVPDGWRLEPLAAIADLERGTIVPERIASGTNYVGLEHIDGEGRFLSVAGVENGDLASNKFLFTADHLLYGKLRPYLKKIARPSFAGVCSTDILPLRPRTVVHRDYLFHYLRQPHLIDLATTRSSGANLPRLSPKQLEQFPVVFPPLPEQRRIAAILDKADAIRRKRADAIRLTDDLLRATFLDLFGDPAANPKGWPIAQFHTVCETRLGKMLDANRQTGQHRRPYMRNFNVQWGRLDLSDIAEMDFEPDEREEFRLRSGDVLICEGGAGVGQTAIWRGEIVECYFQKSLHRVRPRLGVATSRYIASLMWHMMASSSLLGSISTATIPHLTGEKLKSARIPLPPILLQERYEQAAHAITAQAARRKSALAESEALFASLAQRAFRGEL